MCEEECIRIDIWNFFFVDQLDFVVVNVQVTEHAQDVGHCV